MILSAIFTIIGLSLFETVSSVDNAIINKLNFILKEKNEEIIQLKEKLKQLKRKPTKKK